MTKEEYLSFRIQQLCKEKNMTYQTLSDNACIPVNRVYRLYFGLTRNPNIYTMMDICEGLGVTLDEFFDTEEFRSI